MTTKQSLLPLAVVCQNLIYRNHIISKNGSTIELIPFERECEATRFISSVIIVANKNIIPMLDAMPSMGEGYKNLTEVANFLNDKKLYAQDNEEPTLISASPLNYTILMEIL